MQILNFLKRFYRDQKGVTAIEYGILAAGLAVVIGALVSKEGTFAIALKDIFENIVKNLPKT